VISLGLEKLGTLKIRKGARRLLRPFLFWRSMPFGRIALRRILKFQCLFFVLFLIPTLAQRRPVLPQIDEPHPYYFRELYLPAIDQWPEQPELGAGLERVDLFDGGLAVEAETRFRSCHSDYGRNWLRLPAGLVAGREKCRLCFLPERCDGTLAAESNHGKKFSTYQRRRRKCRAAVVARAEKRSSGFPRNTTDASTSSLADVTNGALGKYCAAHRRNKEFPAPLLLQPLRHGNQSRLGRATERKFSSSPTATTSMGTGGFWLMKAEPGAEAREIHYEETSWKVRPDFSPDGSRMIYSSYLGRQWQNLWVMPAKGGDAFPLSYGDWDETNPRWAPDGNKIAYISNAEGNANLLVQEIPSGASRELNLRNRKHSPDWALLQIYPGDETKTEYARILGYRRKGVASMRRMTRGFTRTTDSTGRNARLKDTISIRHLEAFRYAYLLADTKLRWLGVWKPESSAGLSNSRQLKRRKSKSNSRETTGEALRRALGQRRYARSHELRRSLQRKHRRVTSSGGKRRFVGGEQSDRQQGAAIPRHRFECNEL